MSDSTLVTSDLINLYDAALLCGGFTVRLNADGTITPAATGFAVSATDERRSVPVDVPFADFASVVERLRTLYPTANAVGGWVDGQWLYLDPVEIIDDRSKAESLGRLRNQIAIYDLSASEEIRL
ncbi:hypothetical protein [Streptomyces sp. GQFP]|uniref:hypothetical protein n=1 Tax=Streptomyces sp. GQFP TaxID=2907545 RepID=UPI001F19C4B1|nr:hypothetical protein [Streptomyces sp. GQFP]UIX34311.1 hypothetical protein LUX31_32280 [Streptomyces sp. GQFP]